MRSGRINFGEDEVRNGEETLVERINWWERTAREHILKVGAEIVRQKFFEKLYDSSLGLGLKSEVLRRLERLGGEVSQSPEALLKVATNAVLEVVPRMSYEERFSDKRRVDDPESIAVHGGLCVEMSLAAEAALHFTYSLNQAEPNFGGYTQQVLLRTQSSHGATGHHSILKLVCHKVSDGGSVKEEVLFCDPINAIVGRWDDLITGESYKELDGRPAAIVHELRPIELVR